MNASQDQDSFPPLFPSDVSIETHQRRKDAGKQKDEVEERGGGRQEQENNVRKKVSDARNKKTSSFSSGKEEEEDSSLLTFCWSGREIPLLDATFLSCPLLLRCFLCPSFTLFCCRVMNAVVPRCVAHSTRKKLLSVSLSLPRIRSFWSDIKRWGGREMGAEVSASERRRRRRTGRWTFFVVTLAPAFPSFFPVIFL